MNIMINMPKMSQRERWLVCLLPAALVLILSFSLPSDTKELARAEKRLSDASTTSALQRRSQELGQLASQIEQSQQTIEALTEEEARLQALLNTLHSPVMYRDQTLAGALDSLTDRLADQGIQVLSITQLSRGTNRRDWQISIAATWQNMRQMLAESDTFPPGLALSALQMAPSPARVTLPLRRWELVVSDLGGRL